MVKKKDENKGKSKKGKNVVGIDTHADYKPPAKLEVGIPVGTRDFITHRIEWTGLGLLQHSTRGMVADELDKIRLEEERRKNPDVVQPKREKIMRLPEETAELGSYPTNDGRFYHPAAAFVGALIDGLWAAKAVFPGTTELACNVLQRTVRMVHEQCILVNPETHKPFSWGKKKDIKKPPYYGDFRTAVNLNTGGRILTWRPLWRKVVTFVTLSYDAAQIQPSVITQGLELGGVSVGVGAFRPLPPRNLPKKGKGGPFGTFVVTVWDKPIPKGAIPEL